MNLKEYVFLTKRTGEVQRDIRRLLTDEAIKEHEDIQDLLNDASDVICAFDVFVEDILESVDLKGFLLGNDRKRKENM